MTDLDSDPGVRPTDDAAAGAPRARQAARPSRLAASGTLERLHVQLGGDPAHAAAEIARPAVLVVAGRPRRRRSRRQRLPEAGDGRDGPQLRRAAARRSTSWPATPAPACWWPTSASTGRPHAAAGDRPRCPSRPAPRTSPSGPPCPATRRSPRLTAGLDLAARLVAEGADLIALGEMGIGNTTASAAMIAVLAAGRRATSPASAPASTSRAGSTRSPSSSGRWHARSPRATTRSGVLAEVGGFEIGALAGAAIGGAAASRSSWTA